VRVVLLHPLPFDGSVWPALGAANVDDVVAPTLYFLGDDLTRWARAVVDLVSSPAFTPRATEDDPLVVVGCSVGGSCAIEVARLVPDRVKAVVLCGTKAGHDPEPAFRDEALRVLAAEGIDEAIEMVHDGYP
jgi:pimeloyl-[acyl-carrier protein] methyl ester esterase